MEAPILLAFLLTAFSFNSNFLDEQKKFERVRTALEEKEKTISDKLKENKLQPDDLHILIVAYKAEDILEIYAKKKSETRYQKLVSYKVCTKSGELGPKRKYGDNQVPEGFYHIDRFNPASNYHLSLGINYPNSSDKLKSNADNLGGDIFIHGNCVTIGCLPMTDDKIKEIYLYAVHAKNNGQNKIPVYIFPFKMTIGNFEKYKSEFSERPALISFWKNLKHGYDQFMKDKKELNFKVDEAGNYVVVGN